MRWTVIGLLGMLLACTGQETDTDTDIGDTDTDETGDTDTDTGDTDTDTGDTDTGDTDTDTGDTDTGDTDTDTDTGDTDTGTPLSITGDCGILDASVWSSTQPSLVDNAYDFADTAFDCDVLSVGSQEICSDGNLGGSSVFSEALSFEVLTHCEQATLLKTESEIAYIDSQGKKTDILVQIDGAVVGVSVTRAVGYPPEDPYTAQRATDLLTDKLGDILLSTANVAPEDQWSKQILHVLAYEEEHATRIQEAWQAMDPAIAADTVLWITETRGSDYEIYFSN